MSAKSTNNHSVHRFQPGSTRAALSYRNFRILLIGTALSGIGTWMQNFLLPAYLDQRTGSASLVGLLVFTQLGPLLVLSIPAGIIADRVNRTRLVIAMQSVMLIASLAIAALVSTDAPLWTIFAAQFVIGVANALNAPAFSASIGMLVDRDDRSGAISLNSAMINATRIMGPALAALLAVIGFSTAMLFVVNAATYVFLIVPLFFIALPTTDHEHPEQGWRKLLTGINITRGRHVLSRLLIAMCLFSLICLPFVGLFPSVVRINFGLSAGGSTYRWMYVVWGAGALFGSLAGGTLFARVEKHKLVGPGFAAFGSTLAAFAVVRSVTLAFPIAFLLGFAYFLAATSIIMVIQQNMIDHERGAILPLWFMVFGGTVPIGTLVAGPIMDAVGARWVMLTGAVFALGLARWADLRRLPTDAFLAVSEGGPRLRQR